MRRAKRLMLIMSCLMILTGCGSRDKPVPDPVPEESPPVLVMPEYGEEQGPSMQVRKNPVPFFVPDDGDPGSVDQPWIPIPYAGADRPVPSASGKRSDEARFAGTAPYFGRWIVQSRGIDVACYLSWSQSVVDGADAAAFFQIGDQYVIADHSNQDFSALASCQPGDVAVLETPDGKAFYICAAVVPGHNYETSLTDASGESIAYGFNPGGITCYTCDRNWTDLTLAVFYPLGNT